MWQVWITSYPPLVVASPQPLCTLLWKRHQHVCAMQSARTCMYLNKARASQDSLIALTSQPQHVIVVRTAYSSDSVYLLLAVFAPTQPCSHSVQ